MDTPIRGLVGEVRHICGTSSLFHRISIAGWFLLALPGSHLLRFSVRPQLTSIANELLPPSQTRVCPSEMCFLPTSRNTRHPIGATSSLKLRNPCPYPRRSFHMSCAFVYLHQQHGSPPSRAVTRWRSTIAVIRYLCSGDLGYFFGHLWLAIATFNNSVEGFRTSPPCSNPSAFPYRSSWTRPMCFACFMTLLSTTEW